MTAGTVIVSCPHCGTKLVRTSCVTLVKFTDHSLPPYYTYNCSTHGIVTVPADPTMVARLTFVQVPVQRITMSPEFSDPKRHDNGQMSKDHMLDFLLWITSWDGKLTDAL
jgi:hypothetical protein